MKKKLIGIKAQMIMVTFLIVALLTIGILLSISIIVSKEYDKEINFNNETVTDLIASNLENFLGKAYSITEELTQNLDIKSMDGKRQSHILADCVERNPFIELLFVQGNDGMQTGRSSGECGDRSKRWWFSMVHTEGKSFISKSYFSATSNAPVSGVFIPIKENEMMIGSIGMDLKLDYIQQLISENSNEERGRYSFVIDGEGSIIAHPNSEYIEQMYNYKTLTKQVAETDVSGNIIINTDGTNKTREEKIEISEGYQYILNDVMAGNNGTYYFEEKEKGYYSAYTPITLPGDSDKWSIITIQEEDTAKVIISDIIKISATAGMLFFLIAMIMMIIFANSIANPIAKASALLSKTASGDFTVHLKTNSKSEIGVLADSFNEMVDKIASLLSDTQNITSDIHTKMISLDEKSSIATEAAGNIKTSIDDILKGATEQAQEAEESVQMSTSLNEQFNSLSSKTTAMLKEVLQAGEMTDNGVQKVTELKQKNAITYDIIERTAKVIEELNGQSKTIGSILDTLEDISSQTGLLSLNASIEAARAGEYGKSFAVVAEEIQKLSNISTNSTNSISDIITEIQEEISSSVKMMEEVKEVSKEQNEAVIDVNEAFQKIAQAARNMIEFMENIERFVEKMEQNNDKVVSSIDNIAAISQETAACTENATISIREQATEIKQIAGYTKELKEKAVLLEKEISKFKI